jgi:hypothetical protein
VLSADDDACGLASPLTRWVFGGDPVGRVGRLPTTGRGHGAHLADPVLLEALAHVALGTYQPVRSGT